MRELNALLESVLTWIPSQSRIQSVSERPTTLKRFYRSASTSPAQSKKLVPVKCGVGGGGTKGFVRDALRQRCQIEKVSQESKVEAEKW